MNKSDHVYIPFDAEGKAFTGSGKIRVFQSIDNAAKVGFFEDCLQEYAPVRHGVWLNVRKTIKTDSCTLTGTYPTCNLCNHSEVGMSQRTRYCPNCGAVMEVEDDG